MVHRLRREWAAASDVGGGSVLAGSVSNLLARPGEILTSSDARHCAVSPAQSHISLLLVAISSVGMVSDAAPTLSRASRKACGALQAPAWRQRCIQGHGGGRAGCPGIDLVLEWTG